MGGIQEEDGGRGDIRMREKGLEVAWEWEWATIARLTYRFRAIARCGGGCQ